MPALLVRFEVADLHDVFGFGVAGNFAGHLEQAGEARDFVNVAAGSVTMPKGIFPWFAPGAGTFLDGFPLSSDTLAIPDIDGEGRIQIEPELGLLAAVTYDENGRVTALQPQLLVAFDDCSIRREGARRISEKKHWGPASKGVASIGFRVDDLSLDGICGSLRLACTLSRDGETYAYGVDSAVASYTLFGDDLLAWLVDRLREQRAADDTPLEDVGALLRASGQPERVLIGVGASRYEPYGETTFVQVGDEAIVVVYDERVHSSGEVATAIAAGGDDALVAASVLRRRATQAQPT
jgi:hypothetical protein